MEKLTSLAQTLDEDGIWDIICEIEDENSYKEIVHDIKDSEVELALIGIDPVALLNIVNVVKENIKGLHILNSLTQIIYPEDGK